jgi:cytochrome c oxidase cbb3-type subunit 3
MIEFISNTWSIYIAAITLASIVGCGIFLKSQSTQRRPKAGEPVEVTGHKWDETLEEFNNPLPRWWMALFYITIVFGLGYLALYPGLGSYAGMLGWSSHGQYDSEKAAAEARSKPLYDKFAQVDIPALAHNAEANGMGQRLFLNNCAQCHGSDGGGRPGFPNLRDNDWLYGGTPEKIVETITGGRQAMMPAWGEQLGPDGVKKVANYVLSLSGSRHDAALAAEGQVTFASICAACHGADGKGNQAMGAPNLTDHIWLYGNGSEKDVIETITKGRNGRMPAHEGVLSPEKIHLLAAYVYGLSH